MGIDSTPPRIGTELLWIGSAHHLWFLPFILVVTIFAFGVSRILRSRRSLIAGACVFLTGGATHCYVVTFFRPPADHTVALSSANLPVVLWTFAIMCLGEAGIRRTLPVILRTGVTLAFLISLIMLGLVGRNVFLENLSGLLALGAGLSLNIHRWNFTLKRVAGFAYGVYLCHILFVEGGQDVARLIGLSRGPVTTLCVFVVAVIGSLGLCRLLAFTPFAEVLGVPRLNLKRQLHPSNATLVAR